MHADIVAYMNSHHQTDNLTNTQLIGCFKNSLLPALYIERSLYLTDKWSRYTLWVGLAFILAVLINSVIWFYEYDYSKQAVARLASQEDVSVSLATAKKKERLVYDAYYKINQWRDNARIPLAPILWGIEKSSLPQKSIVGLNAVESIALNVKSLEFTLKIFSNADSVPSITWVMNLVDILAPLGLSVTDIKATANSDTKIKTESVSFSVALKSSQPFIEEESLSVKSNRSITSP